MTNPKFLLPKKIKSSKIILNPEDRILFIINDKIILDSTRFQKYGFLLLKGNAKELTELKISYPNFNFYDDWKPHLFGPYSEQLQQDIQTCIEKKLLSKMLINRTHNYSLTLLGRVRWRKFFETSRDEIMKIDKKISKLQKTSLYGLLRLIYDAYPEYDITRQIEN